MSFVWRFDCNISRCDNPCAQAVRRQSVVCRQMRTGDKDGHIVSDIMCNPLMEPPSEETCEAIFPNDCLGDPTWIVDSFGPVSPCCVCVCVCVCVYISDFNQARLQLQCTPRPTPYEFCPVTCKITHENKS